MKFTCDSCQHVFEETEGAAATGEVDCPKCGKPVTIGGPREGAVELAGGFDDFFEVETSSGEVVIKEPSTSQGKPSVGKPAPPPPPKTAAPPPPKPATPALAPKAPSASAPKPGPGKPTDDTLLADFGDFDSLFEKAGKAPSVSAPPPKAAESPKPAPPPASSVEDLLADFDLGETPSPSPPPAAAKPVAPPAGAKGAAAPAQKKGADIDDLLSDFISQEKAPAPSPGRPATSPGVSPRATAKTISAPPPKAVSDDVSRPDQNLEDLFSEVSEKSAETKAPEVPSEEEGDALASGLGIEYEARKKKIPKFVVLGVPSLFAVVGIVAIAMARFTTGGFFGWTFGQRPADGYEPPSSSVLKQLDARFAATSTLLPQDNLEGYKKAIEEFRAILKIDTRHSPTDVRLAESILLVNGNMVDPTGRKEIEGLIAQSEKFHPGILETVRTKARFSLGLGDLADAESLARRALSLKAKDPETLTLLGEISIARGDWEEAARQLNNALEIQNTLPRPRHFLAVIRLQQGNVQEAESILRNIISSSVPHLSSEVELWRLLYAHYGKVDDARQGLQALLQTNEAALSNYDAGRAWRYLAEIAEAGKDSAGAIAAMEKSLQKDPLNHANSFYVGRLFMDSGDFIKAEQQFGRASSLSPNTPEYLIFRGQALRELGKNDDALGELTKGLEKAPGNVKGLYQLGLVQRALGRIDDAIASFENALKNDPRHVDSMIAVGELYLKKDNFSMANTQLRAAIALVPTNPKAHNALGEVFLVTRKPAEALAELKLAEREDIQNATILTNLGRAHLALGHIQDASNHFQKALSVDSTRIDTQVALGELQHKQKEYTKALETYRRVLETQPKDFDTRVKLATVLIDQQSYQEAVTELQEASKYGPNYYPIHLHLGVAWRGIGNLDSSFEELQRAIQLRPSDAEGHYQLEVTLIFRNDPIGAEKAMDAALAADPKFIAPLMALGDYFDSRNLYPKAAEYYLRAEKTEPRNGEILLKLANSYMRDGNSKRAKTYFQKTLQVNKKSADSYVGLGLIAEEEKERQAATNYYRQAQSVDPNDPRPYYYLGFIYREANQKQAAILAFKKYLKLDPQSKEREDIEDQIYSLTH